MRLSFVILSAVVMAGCALAKPAPSPIEIGALAADPPTLVSLGFNLPIINGDHNYDAVASVEYRERGSSGWITGLPLLRVRPEFAEVERQESFAGSVFGLRERTTYDIRVSVVDPDGGGGVQTLTVTTRGLPTLAPATPRPVSVSNSRELASARANAAPGDVITLASGTYVGDFIIAEGVNGTAENPIFVRGSSRDTVILRGKDGPGLQIRGNHTTLEDVTVEAGASGFGLVARDCEWVVIRRTKIKADQGIVATHGTNRNFTIYDNVLEGNNLWPVIDQSTWDDEGIAVTGEGHAIFHNTLSGFGDALGLSRFGAIPSRAVDFYRNEVLWTGDDGIELDDGEIPIRAGGQGL